MRLSIEDLNGATILPAFGHPSFISVLSISEDDQEMRVTLGHSSSDVPEATEQDFRQFRKAAGES